MPTGVKVIDVDYNSIDSLEAAFHGQDVVVSTVGAEGILGQKVIIDAAIKAGVKRFIPSDFGALTTDPAAANLPIHIPLVEIQNYLKSKAEAGLIEYTIFSVGAFADFVIAYDVAFDWKNKSAQLWDDGRHQFSSTTLAGIGKAVVGSIRNPGLSRNRNLFVHELVLTQAQLVELAKKYSPLGTKWNVTRVNGKDEYAKLEQLVKEKPEYPNIMALVKAAMLSGTFKAHYKHVDNDIVGLKILSVAELDVKFAAVFNGRD